jgi:hypothetical protein
MTTTENIFRTNETILDRLLNAGLAAFTAEGVTHADESARQYHYKNPYLIWEQRFESSKPTDSEIERVTVRLSYREPLDVQETAIVEATITAEVFQAGQRSRVRREQIRRIYLSELTSKGLPPTVRECVQSGRQSLSNEAGR